MNRCHIWLARFPGRDEAAEYLRDAVVYTDAPISRFAADQGKRFYDHDWVFVEFDEAGDLDALLRTIQAPEDTHAAVVASAASVGFACNAVVVADVDEFSAPVSVKGDGYQLAYIGCHALWGDA